jgi:hypothetical protein
MDRQELVLSLCELIADIQHTGTLCRQMEERESLPTSRWKEEQSIPTPIRSEQLFYSFKVPWEPDHRCRGKGKRHIIEVHYDSEDEEVYEIYSKPLVDHFMDDRIYLIFSMCVAWSNSQKMHGPI